ncbi:alpha/beta hydrolase [Cyclobacteriaceae bacterium]|nr:alpha/beta hydrolase [Cyclobacteriaceae bacterium]
MLNYTISGKGDVVVLLHGFCEDLSLWSNAQNYFPNNSLLAIDLPGFGNSAILEKQTISEIAKAVFHLLGKLEVKSFAVVGHSLGGYIALEMLKQQPTTINKLVLFHSSVYEDSEEKKENRNKTIAFIEQHGVNNFANSFIGTLFYNENRTQHENTIIKLNEVVKNTSQEAVIETSKAMRDRLDSIHTIANAQIPILFIVGKEDQAVPLGTSLEQLQLPQHSHILMLTKVGHMGMYEAEQASYCTINSFINQ